MFVQLCDLLTRRYFIFSLDVKNDVRTTLGVGVGLGLDTTEGTSVSALSSNESLPLGDMVVPLRVEMLSKYGVKLNVLAVC